MTQAIAKYEDGRLWRLQGGIYYEDRLGMFSMGHLARLKDLPEEYRTQQDRDSIKAMETAFKARRAAEDKEEA